MLHIVAMVLCIGPSFRSYSKESESGVLRNDEETKSCLLVDATKIQTGHRPMD